MVCARRSRVAHADCQVPDLELASEWTLVGPVATEISVTWSVGGQNWNCAALGCGGLVTRYDSPGLPCSGCASHS